MADILDDIEKNTIGASLQNAYTFWHRNRLLFNIIVGASGLAAILFFQPKLDDFGYIGIAGWGIMANLLYSVGYSIESFLIVKSIGENNIRHIRLLMFWSGTLAYCLVNFICVFAYTLIQSPF